MTGFATVALGVIYGCYVIYERYSAVWTALYALSAGDTSVFTNLAHVSALVVVVTLNYNC